MVLMPKSISILPDNAYGYRAFISGIFCISTTKPADTIWHKIIPIVFVPLKHKSFTIYPNDLSIYLLLYIFMLSYFYHLAKILYIVHPKEFYIALL